MGLGGVLVRFDRVLVGGFVVAGGMVLCCCVMGLAACSWCSAAFLCASCAM
jgi:hypothetical protein